MALTQRQRILVHLIVRRYDRESDSTYLDPVGLEQELGAELTELAEDVDTLEAEAYIERLSGAGETEPEGWIVRPTDKGIMAAMGLGE